MAGCGRFALRGSRNVPGLKRWLNDGVKLVMIRFLTLNREVWWNLR